MKIESLRRSHAMAPLSPAHVLELLETCQQLARQRAEIAAVLADLPDSVAALRTALNRLHRLVAGR
jgi:ABC-type hemin transport system ATPase subunit